MRVWKRETPPIGSADPDLACECEQSFNSDVSLDVGSLWKHTQRDRHHCSELGVNAGRRYGRKHM